MKARQNHKSFDYRPAGQAQSEAEEDVLRLKETSETNFSNRGSAKKNDPAPVEFQQKALPLISWNAEKDKFEIGEEAKQLVSAIKGPIAVLAVAGVYRTGKSFLLNRCLLNLHGG